MQQLRIGVVGAGGMGSFHARTLAALPGVEVASVADPHAPNAERLRDELGAAVRDADTLIDDDTLDGVVVASPDDTHVEFALRALERGRPLLLEKPLGITADEARRVVDAEVAIGRRMIQLGFMREYDLAHTQLRDELADIGPIDHVRALHRNANAVRRPLEEVVIQSMVHDAHSVHFLTGAAITDVTASGSGPSGGSFRHVVAVCRLETGAHAVLEFDDGGFAYEIAVEVLGTDGDALTGPPVRPVRRRSGSTEVPLGTDWFGWFADAYRIQDAAWVESLRAGETTGPSTWDGYTAQRVVDAIMSSLATGATVEIPVDERPSLYATT